MRLCRSLTTLLFVILALGGVDQIVCTSHQADQECHASALHTPGACPSAIGGRGSSGGTGGVRRVLAFREDVAGAWRYSAAAQELPAATLLSLNSMLVV
jgi:hypothetical protein